MIFEGGLFASHHPKHLDCSMVLIHQVTVWIQAKQVMLLDAEYFFGAVMVNHDQ